MLLRPSSASRVKPLLLHRGPSCLQKKHLEHLMVEAPAEGRARLSCCYPTLRGPEQVPGEGEAELLLPCYPALRGPKQVPGWQLSPTQGSSPLKAHR